MRPLVPLQSQRGPHLERHVRKLLRPVELIHDVLLQLLRQGFQRVRLTQQPAIERLARSDRSGFGWTIRTMSASDGSLPTAASIKRRSVRSAQPLLHQAFGAEPSDFRPTAPLRMICTKLRKHATVIAPRDRTHDADTPGSSSTTPPATAPACPSSTHSRAQGPQSSR